MSTESLSAEDKKFLEKCEEELKDRYTEKDKEFMKVHTAELAPPPILESWWVPHSGGRRNDRRFDRHSHPYERPNRDQNRHSYDNEYDRGKGSHNYRPRYNY